MSSPKWTKEQQEVIDNRNSDLLVSAAAGSGKTAVLVERIIQMITSKENPIDIDKLLVVTFTNAAASEMRERIGDAIVKELDKNPESKFLQNQILLLNRASITTIHSFCLDVIKSNFHTIELDPNFRIGDQTECTLLKKEALEEVFDELYEENNVGFLNLVESYAERGGDKSVQDMLLQIYSFAMTSPEPTKWLNESAEMFNIDEDFDFSDSIWAKYVLESVELELGGVMQDMKNAIDNIEGIEEIKTFTDKLKIEYRKIENILQACKMSWGETYKELSKFEFENYVKGVKRIPKDAPEYIKIYKDRSKATRDKAKKSIEEIIKTSFNKDSKSITYELNILYQLMKPISDLVLKFDERYAEKKREKSIIDFNDIEHFALKILTDKGEDGELIPSEVAIKYQETFYEIFIDEYQDSNLVQEVLLKSVSKSEHPNRFMVGDVKQSIYRFRQARPELFLSKYNDYSTEKGSRYRKIMLYKNFRSRYEVIDSINYIFENIMSVNIGEIAYTEDERLNLGASFKENECGNTVVGGATEVHLIEKNDKSKSSLKGNLSEDYNFDDEYSDSEEEHEELDNIQIEARMVGKIIKDIMKPNKEGEIQKVYDKTLNDYRPVEFKDIVILLRATSAWAPVFSEELMNMDIPTFADIGVGYFDTIEIKTLISLLQVIENPMQDIPLIAVLKSPIFGFTPGDLVNVRVVDREGSFYEALKILSKFETVDETKANSKAIIETDTENVGELNLNAEIESEFLETVFKSKKFLNKLEVYRIKSMYMSTFEFLWYIYNDSGYYAYVGAMPGGVQRQANLRTLFERAKQFEETSYKGIFNFINFVDKLKKSSGDMGSAKTLGENANVVRIMSIHKSKGLEFPVVICSALGKNFNMLDFRKNILYHQDLGYGPQFVDFDRRISFPSIAKETLKKKMLMENLSEEMRVLYVALTRAKEKLILTGSTKSVDKSLDKWSSNIDSSGKVSEYGIFKGRNYLDWIMPVVIKHKDSANIRENLNLDICVDDNRSKWTTRIWNRDEISINSVEIVEKDSVERIIKNIDFEKYNSNYGKFIEDSLNYRYSYNLSTVKPSSISVTEIKKIQESYDEDLSDHIFSQQNKYEISLKKPLFVQNSEVKNNISASERGTIVHMFMQLVDLNRVATIDSIKEQIDDLIKRSVITENQAAEVNPFKVYKFFKSDLGKRMLKSELISREKVIYSRVNMKDLYFNDDEILRDEAKSYDDETLMMRGIIDAYFEEDGEIVLIDYKTDFVNEEDTEEILNRYKKQLQLYAKALSELTGKKVKEKWIYLFGVERGFLYK
jgi:ATP-dependent helicase/nuclease subunit A